jgi:hypothetical protein
LVQTLQSGVNPQTGAVAINWSVVEAVALFSFLTVVGRAIDKFKFIYSKEYSAENNAISDSVKVTPKGVIPF